MSDVVALVVAVVVLDKLEPGLGQVVIVGQVTVKHVR
jgi:hypothetical protein